MFKRDFVLAACASSAVLTGMSIAGCARDADPVVAETGQGTGPETLDGTISH